MISSFSMGTIDTRKGLETTVLGGEGAAAFPHTNCTILPRGSGCRTRPCAASLHGNDTIWLRYMSSLEYKEALRSNHKKSCTRPPSRNPMTGGRCLGHTPSPVVPWRRAFPPPTSESRTCAPRKLSTMYVTEREAPRPPRGGGGWLALCPWTRWIPSEPSLPSTRTWPPSLGVTMTAMRRLWRYASWSAACGTYN